MSDPTPNYYQPDVNTAKRMGQNPKPIVDVNKPIALKMRVTMRPNTATKHYKRKKRMSKPFDDRKRTFY